jgi:DMSO/TMAO reductase YedYZ heme-binding membrane subunit
MEIITNFLTSLSKLIAKKQNPIQWMFYFAVSLLIGGFSYTVFDRNTTGLWHELGSKAANLSMIAFLLTLIPGMIKRFKLQGPFLPIRIMIMILRKEIGILMFLLAFAHYGWSRVLPVLAIDGNLFRISLFEQFGLAALLMSFPMFLTSNDYLIEKMGDWWKRLHSMAYIIVWALFLHLVIREPSLKSIVVLIFAALEWTSLIKEKHDKNYSAGVSASTKSPI